MLISIRRPQCESSLFHPAMRFFHPFANFEDFLLPAAMMGLMSPSVLSKGQQVAQTKDKSNFEVKVDVQHFTPEELEVKTADNYIIVTGKHEEQPDEHGLISRQFVRRYAIPNRVKPETVTCNLSSDGVLIISAPLPTEKTAENEIKIPISLVPGHVDSLSSTTTPQEDDKSKASPETTEDLKKSQTQDTPIQQN